MINISVILSSRGIIETAHSCLSFGVKKLPREPDPAPFGELPQDAHRFRGVGSASWHADETEAGLEFGSPLPAWATADRLSGERGLRGRGSLRGSLGWGTTRGLVGACEDKPASLCVTARPISWVMRMYLVYFWSRIWMFSLRSYCRGARLNCLRRNLLWPLWL